MRIWIYYWIYGGICHEYHAAETSAEALPEASWSARDGPIEVLGLDADRELIRSLARRLAGDGPDSARIRATVRLTISGEPSKKGGILEALRRSPLVGADLDLNRPLTPGRRVDL